jgi:hypothetical protein
MPILLMSMMLTRLTIPGRHPRKDMAADEPAAAVFTAVTLFTVVFFPVSG